MYSVFILLVSVPSYVAVWIDRVRPNERDISFSLGWALATFQQDKYCLICPCVGKIFKSNQVANEFLSSGTTNVSLIKDYHTASEIRRTNGQRCCKDGDNNRINCRCRLSVNWLSVCIGFQQANDKHSDTYRKMVFVQRPVHGV